MLERSNFAFTKLGAPTAALDNQATWETLEAPEARPCWLCWPTPVQGNGQVNFTQPSSGVKRRWLKGTGGLVNRSCSSCGHRWNRCQAQGSWPHCVAKIACSAGLWTQWGKDRVGCMERVAWKHTLTYVKQPVGICWMRHRAQTGALRWPRGVRWAGRWKWTSRGWGHMYTYGWLMLMYGRNQYKIVKQLSSNEK